MIPTITNLFRQNVDHIVGLDLMNLRSKINLSYVFSQVSIQLWIFGYIFYTDPTMAEHMANEEDLIPMVEKLLNLTKQITDTGFVLWQDLSEEQIKIGDIV